MGDATVKQTFQYQEIYTKNQKERWKSASEGEVSL